MTMHCSVTPTEVRHAAFRTFVNTAQASIAKVYRSMKSICSFFSRGINIHGNLISGYLEVEDLNFAPCQYRTLIYV